MLIGEAETVVEDMASGSNRFSNVIAIFLAVVSVAGAIVAWRIAVASSNAGSSDTQGILATMDREDITTESTITTISHQTAYADFVANNELYKAFQTLGDSQQVRANEFLAIANRAADYIPHRYVDRDETLNVKRDLNEGIANLSVNTDINPKPYFDAGDQARRKTQWLLLDLISLGVALVAFTLSDAIQNAARYGFFIGGIVLFALGSFGALIIEWLL